VPASSPRSSAPHLVRRAALACWAALTLACTPQTWSRALDMEADASSAPGAAGPSLDAQVDGGAGLDGSSDGAPADAGCRTGQDCPMQTPYCLASGACVACTEDSQCPATSASCVGGSCRGCTSSGSCARFSQTPVCDAAPGQCVACTSGEAALCTGAGQVCASGGTTCVACNTNAQCPSASASVCASNACTSCMSDADCAHVSGAPVCNAGTCVACTPGTEAARCGETACDPETLTCTGTARGSLATCRACRADSECRANRKCVPVPFQGAASGFYCMQDASVDCELPYRGAALRVSSRSGEAPSAYCAHNTAVTSCEAIVALTSDVACTTGSAETACGKGARCERVGGVSNRCTYACSVAGECPSFYACNEENSDTPYCGGP
jgi:hypothetical protein